VGLSDNTSFRLVKSSTSVSLRFFVVPLQVTEKTLLIQVIMRYATGYYYSNPSVQLYTTSDHWQPIIINHGDSESTERIFFARSGDGDRANREPARRVGLQAKRGEKIAALRARSSNRVVPCQRLAPGQRAFAAGGGSFPWPEACPTEKRGSRPGKNHLPLCPLCLCGESSIRSPQAVIMRSKVTNRFSILPIPREGP